MNLLLHTPVSTLLHSKVHPKYILYLFLLMDCYEDDKQLWYSFTVSRLRRKLPTFSEENIDNLIDELCEEQLIELYEDDGEYYIRLGDKSASGYVLMSGEQTISLSNVFQILDDKLSSYVNNSSGIDVAKARRLELDFQDFKEIPSKEYTNKTFAELWRITLTAVFQETFRPFMAKEYGQISSLMKSYDNTTLAAMMVHYIQNSHKYMRRGLPSVGHLCTIRDTVFADMKMIIKPKDTKENMRHATNSNF